MSHLPVADLSYSLISSNIPGEARNHGFVGWIRRDVNARKNTNSLSSVRVIISKDETFMTYMALPA